MSEAIKQRLRSYLENDLGIDPGITDDQALFSDGVIDSFDLIKVLDHIGAEYGAQISPLDVNLENFDSLNKMAEFVGAKAAAPSQA